MVVMVRCGGDGVVVVVWCGRVECGGASEVVMV